MFFDFLSTVFSEFMETVIEFELANPWFRPRWFWEDICMIVTWTAEDYLFLSPVFWYFLLPSAIFYAWIRTIRNYFAYEALGRGRLPPGIRGWLTHRWLEFLTLRIFRVDVLSKPYIHPHETPYYGQLVDMAERGTPRPKIIGLGPLKQDAGANPLNFTEVRQRFLADAETRPDLWELTTGSASGLPLLRRSRPALPTAVKFGTHREWDDIIATVTADGIMIVVLHPNDAEEVIRKGWGQRNPLAVMNEYTSWNFFHHWIRFKGTPMSYTNVIVYAPLSNREVEVHTQILDAAKWWYEQQPFNV